MRKLLNKPWFVILLAVAAIAAMWSSLAPAKKPARVASSAPIVADAQAQTSTEPIADEALPQAAIDLLKQLPHPKTSRDPFAITQVAQPTQDVETTPTEPDSTDAVHLSALWTQNGATLALINNRICKVGDSIGRLTIESATAQGVWLTHAKGRAFLETGKSFVLKTQARPFVKKTSP